MQVRLPRSREGRVKSHTLIITGKLSYQPTAASRRVTATPYFTCRTQYGLSIRDANQPLLISRPKQLDRASGEKREALLCIIPELSYMTGLTDDMRQNFKVMKVMFCSPTGYNSSTIAATLTSLYLTQDIALHTRVSPQNRQIAMRQFIASVKNNQEASELLARWGLELDPDTILVRVSSSVCLSSVCLSVSVCVSHACRCYSSARLTAGIFHQKRFTSAKTLSAMLGPRLTGRVTSPTTRWCCQ